MKRAQVCYPAYRELGQARQLAGSPAVRMAFRQGAEELRAGLAGAGSSPLEAVIAEQIAVCWVRLRIYEVWDGAAPHWAAIPL